MPDNRHVRICVRILRDLARGKQNKNLFGCFLTPLSTSGDAARLSGPLSALVSRSDGAGGGCCAEIAPKATGEAGPRLCWLYCDDANANGLSAGDFGA